MTALSYHYLKRLCKVLKLEDRPVTKIVITMEVDEPVRVVVHEFMEESVADELLPVLNEGLVEGLVVTEKGDQYIPSTGEPPEGDRHHQCSQRDF